MKHGLWYTILAFVLTAGFLYLFIHRNQYLDSYVESGNVLGTRIVLLLGADPNRRIKGVVNGEYVLSAAYRGGHEEIASILIASGAETTSISMNQYEHRIQMALNALNIGEIQSIRNEGVDIANYIKPLIVSSIAQKQDSVTIEIFDSIPEASQFLTAAIADAIRHNRNIVAERLIDKTTDIDTVIIYTRNTDEAQWCFATLLHVAVDYNNLAIAKLLIEHGANVNYYKQSEKREWSTDAGKQFEITVSSAGPAVILAVEQGNQSMLQMLIDNKADVNCTNENGENLATIAKRYGRQNIMSIVATAINHES